uniref:AIG1-type G domain-containing protein n=1 Tax=Neolamprologus brichardi TaxID=32507 RepID=A0A3Q4GBY1_NEOBR
MINLSLIIGYVPQAFKLAVVKPLLKKPFLDPFRPKKEEFGSLTKITVGEKNASKTNKTILLVGETGAGKSTLINALFNYSMGVKWEDEVWFQIVEEEENNQTESQTSDVIVYEIFGFEDKTLPYSLTVIDTPGYGDTGVTEHDDMICHRLMDLFKSDDGVHEVHAVGLVMKASINRLSDRQTYVFDSVMSLFGKDMEKNIIALITHSDGITPKNPLKAIEAAKIKCAKNEKDQPVHFLFDNKQKEERTEEYVSFFECAWKITEKGMKGFTTFLEKSAPQNMMKSVKVMKQRIRLTASIQNLKERIERDELKKTEIRQIQEALMKYNEEMTKNEEFTVEVDEVYKVKEDIDAGMRLMVFYKAATCCTVCEENCHYPGCTVTWKPKHCEVMKDGRCTVCTNKCPASVHVKEKRRYVTKTRKIQKTREEMKEKFDKNKSESENMLNLLENLKREKNQLTAEIDQCLDESYKHFVQLDQIALKAGSVSTYIHLDFLIEKIIEKRDTEKVQKLEEMRSRVDERTRLGLRYMLGKIPGTGKLLKK